jgi:nicotinamidase-related amidase
MLRRNFLAALASSSLAPGAQEQTLRVLARSRRHGLAVEKAQMWKASETAIVICDMWNGHYCQSSVRRINVMVPHMNAAIGAARSLGVQIIHSPSGTIDQYAGTPQRKRILAAKPATPPFPLAKWCYLDRSVEAPLPFDDATEPCDDDVVGDRVRRFSRQHPGLTITEPDGISDSGEEMFSFFKQQGIRNAALMGVHTNMCVLGRPFGIRQLTRLGFNVVLVRDLTDSMYDPRQAPWVSHSRGNELIVGHVEQYWCPSIASADLTHPQGKS